jgi:hypothetical protein
MRRRAVHKSDAMRLCDFADDVDRVARERARAMIERRDAGDDVRVPADERVEQHHRVTPAGDSEEKPLAPADRLDGGPDFPDRGRCHFRH